MAIQNLFDDVKGRVGTARDQSREAAKVYVNTQRQAFDVVFSNTKSLAKTEVNAAKDVYQAAKASFKQARADGARQVANSPQAYIPSSREILISAHKETLDLLVKTSNELSNIFNKGYQRVLENLIGKKPNPRQTVAKRKISAKRKSSTTRKTAASETTTNKDVTDEGTTTQ